ncbi:MAG: type II secretion system protein GspN [Deltaproteobacteria bacterium]|nr:type II secretion system protein GspN [Deltaproteobacteria bacterium]
MNPRTVKLLKWVGYPLYTLMALVFCFYWAFPVERTRQMVEDLASTGGRSVTIGALSLSAISTVELRDVVVRITPEAKRARPTSLAGGGAKPAGAVADKPKPMRLILDRVEIGVGLLALMGGRTELDFEVEGLGGHVKGSFEQSKKKGLKVDLTLEGIAARRIPWLQAAGPPFKGSLSGKVQLESPSSKRFNKLTGEVDLECAVCSFGDGKGQVKIPGGLTVPHLPLGRLSIRLKAKKGNIELQQVSTNSKDVDLQVEGSILLRTPLDMSRIDTYIRLKLSEALKKKDESLGAVELAFGEGKRADGYIGILIRGPARKPKVKGSKLGLGSAPRRRPHMPRATRPPVKPRGR